MPKPEHHVIHLKKLSTLSRFGLCGVYAVAGAWPVDPKDPLRVLIGGTRQPTSVSIPIASVDRLRGGDRGMPLRVCPACLELHEEDLPGE